MTLYVSAFCSDINALRAMADGISYQDAKGLNFVFLYGCDYRNIRPFGERISTTRTKLFAHQKAIIDIANSVVCGRTRWY